MTETWQPPADAAPGYDPAPRGRIRRGIWLTRKAWTLIASGRRLWTLPILSAVTLALAAIALFVPLAVLIDRDAAKGVLIALLVVWAFMLTTLSTFFGVAFLGQVEALIDGRSMTAQEAFGFARTRLGAILGWSLLATAVGVAIRSLEQLTGGDIAARLIRVVGELAWSLATFFVVPVIALEDVGPIEALKRSAGAFRKRWGEQVTGDFVIGAASMLAAFGFLRLMLAGLVVVALRVPVLGALMILAGVSGTIATVVVANTVSKVFGLVVYRYATGRPVPAPFTEADVAATFKPKKRGLLRR